jgi:magnesium transporter
MLETIQELISHKMFKELKKYLEKNAPEDIAQALNSLSDEDIVLAFRLLSKDVASDVFVDLDSDLQEKLINLFSDKELKEVIDDLFEDETVEVISEMPADVVERILNSVSKEHRKNINRLLHYPEDSAGSMMTTEYIDFSENMTIKDALSHIREVGTDREDVYTGYVLGKDRKLLGIVDASDLVLNDDNKKVTSVMNENMILIKTLDDQEEVGKLFNKYSETSLPVVDNDGHMVGIITLDDAIDVIKEETEEDFEVMAAVLPNDESYFKTSVFKHAKNRMLWLLILMLSSTLTGAIINHYEAAFVTLPLLVAFIPMIMDTGGNCGSQASTLVIRGLAIDEIETKDFWKVIIKEFFVALGVGLILAIANGIRVFIQYQNLKLSITLGVTLIVTTIMAKLVGGILPIIAKKIKLDPAIMAAPLITTIVDTFAVFAFFNIATLIMGL